MDQKPNSTGEEIKNAVLDALITANEAQVRALRLLRQNPLPKQVRRRVGRSQVDLVEDVLARAGQALHVNVIIEQVKKIHGVPLDRESIVSALTKKVTRNERFVRTEKNTIVLKGGKT